MSFVERIHTVDDPRIQVFRDLKVSASRRASSLIAEGKHLVMRYLSCKRVQPETVLVSERLVDEFRDHVPPAVDLYCATDNFLEDLLGFQFHRGVLAAGRRPEPVGRDEFFATDRSTELMLLCPNVRDAENLGAIVRTARALGVHRIAVGEEAADPYSRRAIRVSMGAIFDTVVRIENDWTEAMDMLEANGYSLIATSLTPGAVSMDEVKRCPPRVAIAVGSESVGLPAEIESRASAVVAIRMENEVDSLNVSVATGIVLHHYRRLMSTQNT